MNLEVAFWDGDEISRTCLAKMKQFAVYFVFNIAPNCATLVGYQYFNYWYDRWVTSEN